MARFLLIAFFLSACASGRLHYVNKPGKRDVVSNDRRSNELNDTEQNENAFTDESEDTLFAENVQDQEPNEQKSDRPAYTDRFISKVEKNYVEDVPEIKPHLEKLKQMRSANFEEEKSERETAGQVLIIVGLILAIVSIFFFFQAENVSNSAATVDGCVQSIMDSIMYTIWGMIFGIGGAILILIGVIFIVTSKQNGSDQTPKTTAE